MADSDLDRVLKLALALELDARQLADVLWLATHLPSTTAVSADAAPAPTPPPVGTTSGDTPETRTDTTPAPAPPTNTARDTSPAGVATLGETPVARGHGGFAVRVPGASALPRPAALARALRPLHRGVVVSRERELDLTASIDRCAETGVWTPVWRRKRGAWLDLALVVDVGRSMDVWRRTAAELHRAFTRYGVFRAVALWSLDTDDEARVVLRQALRIAGPARSPRELLDGIGRRAVMVLTDSVSPAWNSGAAARVLRVWADAQPATLVQVLPRPFWLRTALRHHYDTSLSAKRPAMRATALASESGRAAGDVSLPVVTLGPVGLRAWADVMVGRADTTVPGVLLEKDFQRFGDDAPTAPLKGAARVASFRAVASRLAWRVALVCAAAPVVTLSILRILRATMVPEADTQHVAEVLLAGLLHELDAGARPQDPDAVVYAMDDDVRAALMADVSIATTAEVLRRVTGFIERAPGAGDFQAVARGDDPSLRGDLPMGRIFANATSAVIRALGVRDPADTVKPSPGPDGPGPLRVLVLFNTTIERDDGLRPVIAALGARFAAQAWHLTTRDSSPLGGLLVGAYSDARSSAADDALEPVVLTLPDDTAAAVRVILSVYAKTDAVVLFTAAIDGSAPPVDKLSSSSNLARLARVAGVPLLTAPFWPSGDKGEVLGATLGVEALRALGETWRSQPEALADAIVRAVEASGRKDRSALPSPAAFTPDAMELARCVCAICDARGDVRGTGVLVRGSVVLTSADVLPDTRGDAPWTADFVAPLETGCVRLSFPLGGADQRLELPSVGLVASRLQLTTHRLIDLALPRDWASTTYDRAPNIAWFSPAGKRVVTRVMNAPNGRLDVSSGDTGEVLRGAVALGHDAIDRTALVATGMIARITEGEAPRIVPFVEIQRAVASATGRIADMLRDVFMANSTPVPAPSPPITPISPGKALRDREGWAHEEMPPGLTRTSTERIYAWRLPDGSALPMVYVAPAVFECGDDNFRATAPAHHVRVSKGYYIARTPTTRDQFGRFVRAAQHRTVASRRSGPDWNSTEVGRGDDEPVTFVARPDARAFAKWARLRLPSEAEWELAARGTDARPFPWGAEEPTDDRVWWSGTTVRQGTSPVEARPFGASPCGAFDMVGNVWEWTDDGPSQASRNTPTTPSVDPHTRSNDTRGTSGVLRGGAWSSTEPDDIRAAMRRSALFDAVDRTHGFRCVLSLSPDRGPVTE